MRSRFAAKGSGSYRRAERGQTILLVAVSIVALLSMAALAIDVVTLYVAKSEIQRAADAVALAGAKAVADSGVTTVPSTDTTNLPLAETLATNMATAAVNAMLSSAAGNLVSGQAPTLVGTSTVDFNTHGNNNPTVTVTLQQNNLPTFFARIWARASASSQATATAEVYNPINPVQDGNPMIATQCVKPWLMANANPFGSLGPGGSLPPLIDPTTGNLLTTATGIINNSFYLTADCNSTFSSGCQFRDPNVYDQPPLPPLGNPPYPAVFYVPATVGATNGLYPSSCAGLSPYTQSVAGCDSTVYVCGGSSPNGTWSVGENPAYQTMGPTGTDSTSDTAMGAECLLGFTPPGGYGVQTQDQLSYPPSGWPANAPQIKESSGNISSTSNSIVTIPIIDSSQPINNHPPVTVIGYLQAFINYVGYDTGTGSQYQNYGDVNITVMNVVACGQNTDGSPPVSGSNASCSSSTGQCPGGGNTALPIRLITPP